MVMAALATPVGVLLCTDASVSRGKSSGVRGDVTECRTSVSFPCRRSVIPGAALSLHERGGGRVSSSSSTCSSSSSVVVRAVAADKAAEAIDPASTTATSQKAEYHFLIANAKFMLDEEEHFQELMRERIRHFGELNREQDFWIVIEPKFLTAFPDIEKRLGRPAVALVSTDSTWITFMKLRLDRVLKGVYEADTLTEALAGGNSSVEIRFEKPEKWVAPYSKYEGDWWVPFLPPQ